VSTSKSSPECFGHSELNHAPDSTGHTVWIVPYWFLVVPFMLLSIWLLFGDRYASANSSQRS
jgi:hypothetical protein